MGVVNFTVTKYGKSRGAGAGSIRSSHIRTSGQDTITTVENLEDASGDISLGAGEVLALFAVSTAMRVAFGGTAATATTGHYIPADVMVEIECTDPGTVSMIEAS